MDETRPGDRPTRTVRWGREASTDHSHEDGARAVDAVRLTPQDLQPTRHRRVPAPHRPATTARNCETRASSLPLPLASQAHHPTTPLTINCRSLLGGPTPQCGGPTGREGSSLPLLARSRPGEPGGPTAADHSRDRNRNRAARASHE